MVALLDLRGHRYGRLFVQSLHDIVDSRAVWDCLCDCGNTINVKSTRLRKGVTRSCGCIRRERAIYQNTTHGMSKTKIYMTWATMINRCANETHTSWKYYGARGITVYDRWKTFENFYEDMGDVPEGKTLDRIDPDGHYEPANCRWATWSEQRLNQRRCKRKD